MRVLLLDDEPSAGPLCDALRAHVADLRRAPPIVRDPAALLDVERPDVVVLGPSRRTELARLMEAIGARVPAVPVVVVGVEGRAGAAGDAPRGGAADHVTPGAPEVGARLAAAPASAGPQRLLPRAPSPRPPAAGLVGDSLAMERIRALVRTAARTEAPVLLEGETGTGKEVVARAIHTLGPRAARAFVPVNCAAIPETLAESEFFGHARGAFT